MMSSPNAKFKTAMCKHFEQNGSCPLQQKCHFAHGEHELRKIDDPLPQGSRTQQGGEHKAYQSFGSNQVPSSVSNYKTVKCKFFEKGYCKYGDGCSFAHGEQDVRAQNSPVPQDAMSKLQMNNMQSYGFYQQSIQNQIAHQQVESLIKQMEGYHKDDQEIQGTLNKAKQLLQSGNSQAAASVVNEIISSSDKSSQDAETYNTFINNTQTLGAYIYQQSQYPNQMMYGYNPVGMSQMGMSPNMSASYNGGVDMSQYGQHQSYPKQGYNKNYQNRTNYRGGNRDQSGQEQRYHGHGGGHGQQKDMQGLSEGLGNMQISDNQQQQQQNYNSRPNKNVWM